MVTAGGLAGNHEARAMRTTFFLHIRKTAGTSIQNYMANHWPADACLRHLHWLAHERLDPGAYGFVAGHVGWEYLQRFANRPCVVTSLREPIERGLSHYYYFGGTVHLRALQVNSPKHRPEDAMQQHGAVDPGARPQHRGPDKPLSRRGRPDLGQRTDTVPVRHQGRGSRVRGTGPVAPGSRRAPTWRRATWFS